MPALRLDKVGAAACREEGLRLVERIGPGGFILFGGGAVEVAALCRDLQEASGHKLLLAADLERGAGQQFRGLTRIPTPMAIAACPDAEPLAALAGRLTACEAQAVGINLVFAPLVDVNSEPGNPIINVRAFSDSPDRAARLAAQWIHGAQAVGVAACAKHFPGHGNTRTDSHLELPEGPTDADSLRLVHGAPFRAAIAAGVRAIMVAHMTVPALDASGLPATLSRPVVTDYLRGELGFRGLIVTDALIMEGVHRPEPEAARLALAAGNDLLLYPRDPAALYDALRMDPTLDPGRALVRHEAAFGIDVVARVAADCVTILHGRPQPPRRFRIVLDDDRLDPEPFRAAAIAAGLEEDSASSAGPPGDLVCAVYAMPGAWRGRCGPSAESLARIPEGSGVIAFGDPYWVRGSGAAWALAAWDDHPATQDSALQVAMGRRAAKGRLPIA